MNLIRQEAPEHFAHVLAKLQAGAKMRVVMIAVLDAYSDDAWISAYACAHSSKCGHCRDWLADRVYVNLGIAHGRTGWPERAESPVEVDPVPGGETPAPAASHPFPDGASQ